MAQQIQFVYLAQSEYDALTKQGNILYFTSDTHRIYRGTELYATTSFDTVSASSATFGDLTVTGNVSMSLSQVEFERIEASEITVDGSSVSLEGHTHSIDDIEDYEDNTFWVTGSVNTQTMQVQVDQSFSDAVEAANAGKHIRAKMVWSIESVVCPWVNTIYNSNGSATGFDFHIMLDTNRLNPDHISHPYLIRVYWGSNGFTVYPYELSETSHGHIELSGITESSISKTSATFQDLVVTGDVTFSVDQLDFQSLTASSLMVNGSQVSLEGHTHSFADVDGLSSHVSQVTASISAFNDQLQGITQTGISKSSATFGDLTITGELTCSLDQVQFGSIQASDISVNGSQVSLEGHVHSISDISGLSSILSGITESSIWKNQVSASAATFDQVTADIGNFRLISVSGSANFAVNNVSANAVSVNGTPVSLEGHTHSSSDISDFASAVVSAGISVFASASAISNFESRISGLESTIGDIEQLLHQINTGESMT